MFLSARRLQQTAVAFRPSTFLRFKEFLVRQKYKFLFSSGKQSKPGPKGPSREIIAAVDEFKQRNPRCGCPRIAQQLSTIFGIDLQHKFNQFRDYFNEYRVHAGINGDLPNQRADKIEPRIASFENYSWESHCNGLFQMPKAA